MNYYNLIKKYNANEQVIDEFLELVHDDPSLPIIPLVSGLLADDETQYYAGLIERVAKANLVAPPDDSPFEGQVFLDYQLEPLVEYYIDVFSADGELSYDEAEGKARAYIDTFPREEVIAIYIGA